MNISSMNITAKSAIAPLAEGLMAMAIMSTMSNIIAMGTIKASVAGGFGASVGAGATAGGEGGWGWHKKYGSLQEELKDLNKSIPKLGYVLENRQNSLIGTREHKLKLMKEYKLGVLPSLVELKRKYHNLYVTELYVTSLEEDVGRMETRMMLMKKRRKEIWQLLGIYGVEEQYEQPHTQYTQLKRFTPPTRRY